MEKEVLVKNDEVVEKKVLLKDSPKINHKSELEESIKDIAEVIERAGGVGNNREVLLTELLNNSATTQEHKPNHEGCDKCDTDTLTEKRICRCMFYYGKNEAKCSECKLRLKWNNVGKIQITDYERPTKYVLKDVGGMDLVIDDGENRYAVEVKPPKSKETIARMFAEILTYTVEFVDGTKDCLKPAICFFEDSEQMKQYNAIKQATDIEVREALALIERYIKIFYFKCDNQNPCNFEICEYKQV